MWAPIPRGRVYGFYTVVTPHKYMPFTPHAVQRQQQLRLQPSSLVPFRPRGNSTTTPQKRVLHVDTSKQTTCNIKFESHLNHSPFTRSSKLFPHLNAASRELQFIHRTLQFIDLNSQLRKLVLSIVWAVLADGRRMLGTTSKARVLRAHMLRKVVAAVECNVFLDACRHHAWEFDFALMGGVHMASKITQMGLRPIAFIDCTFEGWPRDDCTLSWWVCKNFWRTLMYVLLLCITGRADGLMLGLIE